MEFRERIIVDTRGVFKDQGLSTHIGFRIQGHLLSEMETFAMDTEEFHVLLREQLQSTTFKLIEKIMRSYVVFRRWSIHHDELVVCERPGDFNQWNWFQGSIAS